MKTDTLYTSIVGGSMAWIAYFVGGIDHLIKALVIFMTIDYALGFMVSLVFKKLKAKRCLRA